MNLRLNLRRDPGPNARCPSRESAGQPGSFVRRNVRTNLPDTGDLRPETGDLNPSARFKSSPCALAAYSDSERVAGGWEE